MSIVMMTAAEPPKNSWYMEGQYTEQPFGMETDEQTGEITFTLEDGVFTRFIKLHSHINALDAEGEPIMDPGSFDLDPESVRVYALSGGVNKFYSYKPDGGRAVHSALTDTMRSDRYSYYPDSDLVQIAGDYACRYDENGNMTEKGDRYTESGGEITIHKEGRYTLYKYDLLNRLVSVSRLNGEGEVEVAVSYRYSHRNLRIERTDKAGTVRYVFDLDGNIIEEHRGDELIRYVFRRGKHLAKITPDGTYYYGTDRLGSTTVMFDGEGSVVWRGDVSPFGELVSSEGSIEERVKFTGKDYDEAAGLYYFNARWYDAELGRFTTEDPARDGLNWYVYVRNNPLRYVDPTGLEAEDGGSDPSFASNLPRYSARLIRNANSWQSGLNEGFSRKNVGLDILKITNNLTSSSTEFNVQSVANHPEYPIGNTVVGDFDLKAYSESASFNSTVLLIANAETLSGIKIGDDGHELDSDGNSLPTGRWLGHEPPPFSGGCIIPATEEDQNKDVDYFTTEGINDGTVIKSTIIEQRISYEDKKK